jgi:hypothetical protein
MRPRRIFPAGSSLITGWTVSRGTIEFVGNITASPPPQNAGATLDNVRAHRSHRC